MGSGSASSLAFDLHDPLATPILNVTLQFELYAFNAYPGNATGSLPAANVPELVAGGSPGASVTLSWGSETPGASVAAPVSLSVPTGAPSGEYALRCRLVFDSNRTAYLLESRGYFSAAAWSFATNGASAPNGTPTLNVSRLNVSGVLPETGLLVTPPPPNVAIYALLGASILAAGAGAYYWFRGGPGSSSGARSIPGERRAESALGNKRTSDGD
ncbi:MAG TPA: hypothetical protein VFF67_09255 [Thermoplasmata archaeon]|nr:hypothetical protein [Thermoplasmata archaeon]